MAAESLRSFSWLRGEKGFAAEFSLVIAVVANEVSNLAEGFVRDECLL